MVRDTRHDSADLLGAICPTRRVGAAFIMPAVNTAAMNEHLQEIGTQGAHAVLVCDGAGWHQQGGTLCLPDNITLLLPAYAPELNPMENVCEYLRANQLSRFLWNSDQAIVAACKEAWDVSSMTRTESRPSALAFGWVSASRAVGMNRVGSSPARTEGARFRRGLTRPEAPARPAPASPACRAAAPRRRPARRGWR